MLKIPGLMAVTLLAMSAHALEQIDIFTYDGLDMPTDRLATETHLVPDIHYVDLLKRVEDAISHDLPANEEDALKLAQARLQSPDFIKQAERARTGMDAVLLANELGLTALPAVVFDRKYIVYGELPSAALNIYQAHKGN